MLDFIENSNYTVDDWVISLCAFLWCLHVAFFPTIFTEDEIKFLSAQKLLNKLTTSVRSCVKILTRKNILQAYFCRNYIHPLL